MKIYVDYRACLSLVGTVLKYIAATLLFPIAVAIFYRESVLPFITTIVVTVTVGTVLERLDPEPDLGHREGFLFIGLTWLAVPLLGTLPYLIAGQGTVAHPVNALFESMSGFTTDTHNEEVHRGDQIPNDSRMAIPPRFLLVKSIHTSQDGGLSI